MNENAENDLQYVVRMLQDSNLKVIAKNVGLAYLTVYLIKTGKNNSPSFNTVNKLAEYFKWKNK